MIKMQTHCFRNVAECMQHHSEDHPAHQVSTHLVHDHVLCMEMRSLASCSVTNAAEKQVRNQALQPESSLNACLGLVAPYSGCVMEDRPSVFQCHHQRCIATACRVCHGLLDITATISSQMGSYHQTSLSAFTHSLPCL